MKIDWTSWHRPMINLVFYFIIVTLLYLPICIPQDWRVIKEASEPAVKAIYIALYGKYGAYVVYSLWLF